ncbi:MAG: hypothetical protein IT472_11370 [Thermomonas sp.]|uniref:hypothetical protein n=1 Tax=Thermomonas sp. TaxID=1971895 RepID=UPI002623CDBF|nr:hypothetical protein [Thermomonas sp.]MCC7097768.1 hypothetical protein [Thermomonas sp.]
MRSHRHLLALALAAALVLPLPRAQAEPFTFQGFLEQSGSPLNGNANLAFKLYDAQSGGTQLGSTITANTYLVLDGVFTIDLNFAGVAFAESNRWLQVEVGGTPMGPRIEILPTPVAASARALQGRGVSATAPSSGQVLKWNGSAWAPAADDGGTSYSAGTGLALSGSTFSVAPTYQMPQACTANQVAKWSGAAWICASDGDTTYSAGNGLTLTGSTFSVTPTYQMPQACTANQVAKWSGTAWICAGDGDTTYSAGNGLTLTGSTFSADFAGSGAATTVARSDHGHYGQQFSGSSALRGLSISQGNGTSGSTALIATATASSGQTDGVVGVSNSNTIGSRGVFGHATASSGDARGVQGQSNSTSGRGVFGLASAATGNSTGVWGETASSTGRGVLGIATATSGANMGVFGRSDSPEGSGVRAMNTATSGSTAYAVWGVAASNQGRAIFGDATATIGDTHGVYGRVASPLGTAVRGESAATSGPTIGVAGSTASVDGTAVHGEATATSGQTIGVHGLSASNEGTGVRGEGPLGVLGASSVAEGAGVWGSNLAPSGDAYGVVASTNSTAGTALLASAPTTTGANRGVLARTASSNGVGLRAENNATSGGGLGNALVAVGNMPSGDTLVVEANGTGSAWAINARSAGSRVLSAELTTPGTTGSAVRASVNSASGKAGEFVNVAIGGAAASFTGNVSVSGTLSKGGGSFKIDHPLDPANKYLLHSFVESPDMMNVYNGNVVTDANGRATIELPAWFEALNRDFRYQLTVIGSFARAMVSEEVAGNRFAIRTDEPRTKVSWQITGIRHDPWAEHNRIPVELDKAPAEKGRFLHPEAHGQPAAKRIGVGADDEKPSAR